MKRVFAGLLTLIVTIAVIAAGTSTVFAKDPFVGEEIDPCKSAPKSALCTGKTNSTSNPLTGPNGIIRKATTIIAVIAGVASVLIIMVGGFMYITAGGDAGKVGEAKKAIIYAIVGLVVVALGQTLVIFILSSLN